MSDLPAQPRPAATLIPVRDGDRGIEVFMLQRSHQASFVPGGFVFPGGAVDARDADPRFAQSAPGLDALAADRILGVEGALPYWVAAVRECYEEAGLLLAVDRDGRLPGPEHPVFAGDSALLRRQLASGTLPFAAFCRDFGLVPALDRLVYFAHWVTPVGLPRRFDTRFFLCVAPPGQVPAHDDAETIGHMWIDPARALEGHRAGEFEMMFATVKTLQALAAFGNTDALMLHARRLDRVPKHEPRVSTAGGRRRVLIAGDAAYAEVGKLDPLGGGKVSCVIEPGAATALSPHVRRVTAPNTGFMTGPGTNSYLVGGADGVAVIDPGPADEAHVARLLEHAGDRLRWIFVTHTHVDHSPAARMIKDRTGAPVYGMPAPEGGSQDRDFRPDAVLADGERVDLGGITLRAVHTPGHASNHLCYLLEEERLLFTGDHVMQGSTVVINPPDGDLLAYLSSLQRLKELEIDYFAPGHGFLIDKPHAAVDRILAHRRARENKLVEALRRAGTASIGQLLESVYDDVPAERHGMARRSLLANLFKLAAEGRASGQADLWRLSEAADGA